MTNDPSDDWEQRARSVADNLVRAADELQRLIDDYRRFRGEGEPDERPKP